MWTIFKVFIESCTILFPFYVLVFWPRGTGDLGSPSRDRTFTPFAWRGSLNHWATREVQWLPVKIVFMSESLYCLLPVIPSCFPGGSDGKESACQCRRPGFDPCVGKIPWGRERLPTPVFLPGESHGQRSLEGYSPRGCRESDTTE